MGDSSVVAAPRARNSARTRERILLEGRRQFASRGYNATTARTVADAAEVSPNLITRYFGGKEGLFLAATQTSLNLDRVLAGPRATIGARLAESMVSRWTSVDADPLLILQRVAGDRPEAADALARFLDRESLEPMVRQLCRYGLSRTEATDRAAGIEALVMGVVTRRRVLAPSIGDLDTLRDWLAVSIQRLVGTP